MARLLDSHDERHFESRDEEVGRAPLRAKSGNSKGSSCRTR